MEELTKLRPKDRSRNKLEQTIREAGIPIAGISGFPPEMRLDFAGATEAQRKQAQAIADGWDWSEHGQKQRDRRDSKRRLRELLDGDSELSVFMRTILRFMKPNGKRWEAWLSEFLEEIGKDA